MIDFQNIKLVVPVFHRREPRSFQLIIYGLTLEEAQNLGRDAIDARLERRGFSIQDWYPDYKGIHSEYLDYKFISVDGRRPQQRGVYNA